jgi:hypothetical protein
MPVVVISEFGKLVPDIYLTDIFHGLLVRVDCVYIELNQ